MKAEKRVFRFVAILLRAWTGWRRFLFIWVAVTIPFAIFRIGTGAAEPIPIRGLLFMIPLVLVVTYIGAVVYAATEEMRSSKAGYYASWALAGCAAGLVASATVGVADWLIGTGESAFLNPLIWLAGAALGAFTGIGYAFEAIRNGWSAHGG